MLSRSRDSVHRNDSTKRPMWWADWSRIEFVGESRSRDQATHSTVRRHFGVCLYLFYSPICASARRREIRRRLWPKACGSCLLYAGYVYELYLHRYATRHGRLAYIGQVTNAKHPVVTPAIAVVSVNRSEATPLKAVESAGAESGSLATMPVRKQGGKSLRSVSNTLHRTTHQGTESVLLHRSALACPAGRKHAQLPRPIGY